MILCAACGQRNPLTSRHCQTCGEKLVMDRGALAEAVQDDFAEGRSLRWLARGTSAMSVGGFLLICAVLLRYVVVPTLPPPDIPPVDVGSVLPAIQPDAAAKPLKP